jgi:Na+/H+ antiporter NhaD/arsenite permease-like protein
MIVVAANSGGAWSPIGDVTTIMLWINGNVSTVKIIMGVFLPSLFSMVIPLLFVSLMLKGKTIAPPETKNGVQTDFTSHKERLFMLVLGVGGLLFVPVLKTVTHLPPYVGMLFSLGIVWITTEIIIKKKSKEDRRQLSVIKILEHVDVPTIFFFLGILMGVAALESAGHLDLMAKWLDKVTNTNYYIIASAIGVLSSIVDNVPLTASAMGMYPIEAVGHLAQDGLFWELLAYTAGTGGSMLIIGSAAGVAAMGLEKIDFIWYAKKISWLAAIGYFSGIIVYYLQETFFHILG